MDELKCVPKRIYERVIMPVHDSMRGGISTELPDEIVQIMLIFLKRISPVSCDWILSGHDGDAASVFFSYLEVAVFCEFGID